jgi:hypothetical protein
MITHDRGLAAALPRQIEMLDGLIVSDSRPAGGDALAGVSVGGAALPGGEDS